MHAITCRIHYGQAMSMADYLALREAMSMLGITPGSDDADEPVAAR